MTLAVAGKIAWVVLVIAWYVLRRPFERRARRAGLVRNEKNAVEWARLSVSTLGLGVLPFIYVISDWPQSLSYPARPLPFGFGLVAAIGALVLFRLTHKALGKMWSVSLQLKQDHKLVTTGIYRYLRHPMYSAFWLMAVAQALLLPNLLGGLAGLFGFGFLFALRLGPEEHMMEEAFGDEYRAYRKRTWRIIPFLF